MKTLKTLCMFLLSAFIGIMIYVMFWPRPNSESNGNHVPTKTDTVYVSKPFQLPPEYVNVTIPKLVTVYETEYVKIDSIRVDTQFVYVHTDEGLIKYDQSFLTNFPEAKKLLQFDLTKKKLEITTLSPQGTVATDEYNVDTEKYNYRYQDNQMSFKKKPLKIHFEAGVLARPFTNMYDVNAVISLNTGKFNYVGGVNIHYYPGLKTNVGITPIIGVNFRF